jgi:hypothetical protein
MSQDDVVVEAAAPKKHNNNDVKRLVGKEVVEPPRDINALQQGAGENASLNPKGGFEPCPHLSGGAPMCVRPRPEMRRAATRQSGSPVSQSNSLPRIENPTEAASDLQAEKLRRLYFFCRATAYTIASLAFAGCPR